MGSARSLESPDGVIPGPGLSPDAEVGFKLISHLHLLI